MTGARLRAYLAVESTTHSLYQLREMLDHFGTGGYERGSLSPFSRQVRNESSWTLDLVLTSDLHAGNEALSSSLESLGPVFAQSLGAMHALGCNVLLMVIQEISHDPQTKGIILSPTAIEWLATAHAKAVVDQYIG